MPKGRSPTTSAVLVPRQTAREWCIISWVLEEEYFKSDLSCVWVTESDHCKGVTYKDDIHVCLVGKITRRVVMCCHHCNWCLSFVEGAQRIESHLAPFFRIGCVTLSSTRSCQSATRFGKLWLSAVGTNYQSCCAEHQVRKTICIYPIYADSCKNLLKIFLEQKGRQTSR